MKTRFQRLSFAVGLSLFVGAVAGQLKEKEVCVGPTGIQYECKDDSGIRFSTNYNIPLAAATSFAVFGLCLMINAFVKEVKQ